MDSRCCGCLAADRRHRFRYRALHVGAEQLLVVDGGGADHVTPACDHRTAEDQRAPSTTSESPLDQLPGGIGEAIGEAGAAFGTISANDGTTLTLDAIGGSQVMVQTNPRPT